MMLRLNLYKKIGFKICLYNNKKDILKLEKLGINNNYVVICKNLKKVKDMNLEIIDFEIAKNMQILKKLNKK